LSANQGKNPQKLRNENRGPENSIPDKKKLAVKSAPAIRDYSAPKKGLKPEKEKTRKVQN